MNDLLVVDNVTKKFGDFTALNGVSINVPKNTIFGLLGPNGAGKTTLIRIINQITMPDTGKLFLGGKLLSPNDVQHIGYLPEERGLYKNMKVGEQAIYLAMLKGMSKNDARANLKFWFEKFGIESWWSKKINELSKGQGQKIQFIITVMHKPKLLIFDEVFSGLDPINANLIRDEILELRDKGATIIFSTHRMESVEELCDHIALIDKSNKILEGNLNEIKREYKTNTFQVGLQTTDNIALEKELKERFTLSKASFRSLEDDLKLNIQLGEKDTSSELIQYLSSKAQVNHFVEIIPNANDIFIQAVKKNN